MYQINESKFNRVMNAYRNLRDKWNDPQPAKVHTSRDRELKELLLALDALEKGNEEESHN